MLNVVNKAKSKGVVVKLQTTMRSSGIDRFLISIIIINSRAVQLTYSNVIKDNLSVRS